MTPVIDRLTSALTDRYRVEREIGAGGMATVYLAHDLKHDRDVAIKVLHPDLGAALGGERFLTEIRTTARLQHPHILPLLDSGGGTDCVRWVRGASQLLHLFITECCWHDRTGHRNTANRRSFAVFPSGGSTG